MNMNGFPIYEVKGLDHPLINGVITAMIRTEKGIEVTVDDRITFLFVCAVDMIPVGGRIGVNNKTRIAGLEEIVKIQGEDGNWNADQYMFGMYNGMVLALGIMTGKEPAYRTWPYKWWQYTWKQIKLWFWFKIWFRYFVSPISNGGDEGADNRPIKL